MRQSIVYLVRHSITEGNIKGLFYGWTDYPILPEGIRKVEGMAAENRYPNPGYAKIYTSGLLRTEMTLHAMYGMDLPHEAMEEFKEFKFGDWEGLTYEGIMAVPGGPEFMRAEDLDFVPPGGGESYNMFHGRIERGWAKIVEGQRMLELSHRHSGIDAKTIIVAHGGVINHIMNFLFGDDMNSYELMPDTAEGYAIHFVNGEPATYEKL